MAAIVVVGGGLAGLACAWKLRRAGHEVEVLERRRPDAGDPVRHAAESGGLRAADRDLIAAAAALGVAWRRGPVGSDTFLCNGRLETLPAPTLAWLLRAPGGSRWRRLAWARGLRRVLRQPGLRAAELAPFDGASFEAVLARSLGDDAIVAPLGALAGLACGEAPARLSHALAVAALAREAAAPRPLFLEGGLAALRRALTAAVTVRWGCEAVDVESGGAGARVRFRTQGRLRSVLADAAVVALPAEVLLRCCPKLTPDERGFFEAVESAPELAVHLRLERLPPGLRGHRLFFPAANATLRTLVSCPPEPGAAPAEGAAVLARLAAEPSRRLASAPDAELAAAVLDALAETPLGRLRPLASDVWRGPSPRPRFRPGAVERIARFERRIERSPRLAFAGRALLGPGPSAAFTSGLRGATAIARAL